MPLNPQQVLHPGVEQMTVAGRLVHAAGLGGMRRARSSTRRRKRAAKPAKRRASRRGSGGKKLKRLVKGSAAAKRYMAKIRRKRR